jgi:septum site-determining protein MinD
VAHVLVVTSGKGGVGKTTSTAALGAALAHLGDKLVVIDFDVGLRNLVRAQRQRTGTGLRLIGG